MEDDIGIFRKVIIWKILRWWQHLLQDETWSNYRDMAGQYLMPHNYHLALHFWCCQAEVSNPRCQLLKGSSYHLATWDLQRGMYFIELWNGCLPNLALCRWGMKDVQVCQNLQPPLPCKLLGWWWKQSSPWSNWVGRSVGDKMVAQSTINFPVVCGVGDLCAGLRVPKEGKFGACDDFL